MVCLAFISALSMAAFGFGNSAIGFGFENTAAGSSIEYSKVVFFFCWKYFQPVMPPPTLEPHGTVRSTKN